MFFVQTSKHAPKAYLLTMQGVVRKNNQLLTKSHVELEDDSDECHESILFDLFRV
jgi:hypothetical protein